MSKIWNVRADFTVIADTEEEVWDKWASDKDVTYECIYSIDYIEDEEFDEEGD